MTIAWANGELATTHMRLAWRTSDGSRWAFDADDEPVAAALDRLRIWSETPVEADRPGLRPGDLLVNATPAGAVRVLTREGWTDGLAAPYQVWGWGDEFAAGALAAGADALQAIAVATRLHTAARAADQVALS